MKHSNCFMRVFKILQMVNSFKGWQYFSVLVCLSIRIACCLSTLHNTKSPSTKSDLTYSCDGHENGFTPALKVSNFRREVRESKKIVDRIFLNWNCIFDWNFFHKEFSDPILTKNILFDSIFIIQNNSMGFDTIEINLVRYGSWSKS